MTFASRTRRGARDLNPQDTGWKSAGAVATGGAPLWTDYANVRLVDGLSATVNFVGEDGSSSAPIWLSDFAFDLPLDAVIDGVEVRLRGPANPDQTAGLYRAFLMEGAAPGSPTSISDQPLSIDSLPAAYDEIVGATTGGIEAAWGLGRGTAIPFALLTPVTVTRLNDPGFGVSVESYNVEASDTWYYILESVQMRVHWHLT